LERAVPSVAAALCLITGDRTEATIARSVFVFETNALETAGDGGTLYGRDAAPLMTARLIRFVRAFLAKVAPPEGGTPVSPADALAQVAALPDADPVVLRLMVAALGLLPTGTVVELTTGEWAVVVGVSSGAAPHRPRIRVVTDARGHSLDIPADVDLADPGLEGLVISRVIPPELARFNTTSALSALD
jgi:hypothetical protein